MPFKGETVKAARFFLVAFWLLAALAGLPARAADDVSESVITASLPGRSISALVTHWREHDAFRRAILLMPGYPGIMKLRSVDDYGLKGNFLLRSRQYWLDRETVVFSVDAPSDEWNGFSGVFRASERYAEDIRELVGVIRQQYGLMPLAVVGTSEGSVSAYYAARAVPRPDTKVIFTNSVFLSSSNVQGLSELDFDRYGLPMLWVHHVDDPCRLTPYAEAQRLAQKTGAPLITVKSGNAGRGPACQPYTQHGFIGVEEATVRAMKAWIEHGVANDVVQP
jgi:hypothetical protein